ncbi:signal peptidase II [Williamsoniiplasma somnilux]|uniref:Lipoprotein signal peptidase n=1 Tax=Williamsoniiplasma somnilux TaxID=215578 RepID=A0A2K8P195_9MOLU|nr:signal peptidase II [Williamsoniiplasma somnilux]ATZ18673.1 signal peptidase II [Williamsoniiplasma somnilux]
MWLNFKEWIKSYDFKWKFKLKVILPIILILAIFDWVSKGVIAANMEQGEHKSFIDGFLGFIYTINPGSAYSINADKAWLAIILASVVTILLLVLLVFINEKKILIGIAFIFAGSFANLLGRAWAPVVVGGAFAGQAGGVVDFLHWEFGFLNSESYIFNLADTWVNIGIIIMLLAIAYDIIVYLITLFKKKPNSIDKTTDAVNSEVVLETEVKNNKLSNNKKSISKKSKIESKNKEK